MRKDTTEFRQRFQRWKNGEQVYDKGRVIPHYEGGEDAYYGSSRIEPITGEAGNLGGITVYGKKPKYNYLKKWPGKTHPLTASDAAKAWDTMVTPALSWALPNVFRGIDAVQKGDAVGVSKEALKAAGLKGITAVAANPSLLAPGSAFWMNPITKQVTAGTAASEGVNLATNVLTPYSTWSEGVSDVVNQTTGWNPQNSWWGQAIAEATNTGWLVNPPRVMSAVETVANGPINVIKRGAETVARTNIVDMKNALGDSYKAIKEGLTGKISTNMGLDPNISSYVPYTRERLAANLKYILTGNKTGIPGYSNSFAPQLKNVVQQNKGFWNPDPTLANANDVIDAFLYQKPIDPRFGVKLVGYGKGFGDEHTAYIAKNYSKKAKDIPVYEVQNETFIPEDQINDVLKWQDGNFGNTKLFSANKADNTVDVSGYRLRYGTAKDGTTVSQGQDIWKFKPSEYNAKHDKSSNSLKNLLLYTGASLFDKLGVPVIFKSKWVPTKFASSSRNKFFDLDKDYFKYFSKQ